MIPDRPTSPTVGLIPTSPHAALGDVTEPSVSEPIAAAQYDAATPPAEPELDPDVFRSSAYGFFPCPPRPLQPLDECVDRMFAHSLRLVFPKMIAPAARNRSATYESRGGVEFASASDPAEVCIRSAVSMLSLMRIGIPCNGPRGFPAFLSASR